MHDIATENTCTETDVSKLKEQVRYLETKCKPLEKTHETYVTSSQVCLFFGYVTSSDHFLHAILNRTQANLVPRASRELKS